MIPTPRLIVLLGASFALGVAAVFWPGTLAAWRIASGVLAAAAAIDAFLVWRMHTLEADRTTPGSLALGAWHRIHVRIRNASRTPRELALYDHHPPNCEVRGL